MRSISITVVNQTGEHESIRLADVEQIWPNLDQLIGVLHEPTRYSQTEILSSFGSAGFFTPA